MTTRFNRRPAWLALAALLSCTAARAEGVIYKCVDAAGHTEFTDVYRGSYCKVLEGTGAITTPPARRAQAGPPRATAPSPADFPRVDGDQLRDDISRSEKNIDALKREIANIK